jgi:GxxExxY protein
MKHIELTEQLIGIFYEIYNELGHGFIESLYEKAYTHLLAERGIKFEQQSPITVFFRGVELGEFRADIIVESSVMVELKAVRTLDQSHEKQVINYLRATKIEVGMLFNFGPRAQVRRLVLDNERKQERAAAAGLSL